MEAAINTYTINIPLKDLSFFNEMVARMGWSFKKIQRKHKCVSIAEDELRAINLISSPWPDDDLSADAFVEMCESGRSGNREIIEI